MPNRRTFLGLAAGLSTAGLLGRAALAATSPVFKTNGAAVHGYDVVGYFQQGQPVDGRDEFSLKWRGASWRFSSAANMAAFEMAPRKYAPKYGGYCAFAMSKGAIATTVPEAWTIHGDRLYLNYSTGVRDIWRRDIPPYVKAADGHWPQILNA